MQENLPIRALKYIRAREWMPKIVEYLLVSSLFYYTLEIERASIHNHLALLLYQFFFYSYSYSLNDVTDVVQDRQAGILKEAHKLTTVQNLVILVFLALPSLILPFFFSNLFVGLIGIGNLLFATAYSLHPIRLKEKGVWGLLPPALSQRVIPFMMFALLLSNNWGTILYFSVYLLLLGFCVIVDHQITDYTSDYTVTTYTFAVQIGKNRIMLIKRFLRLSLLCHIFSIFLFFGFQKGLVCFLSLLSYSSLCLFGRVLLERFKVRNVGIS